MTRYEAVAELARMARDTPNAEVYRLWSLHGFGGGDRGEQFALFTDKGVSGRVVTAQVVEEARERSGGRGGIYRVQVSDTEAVTAGLACGGWAEVLVHAGALLPDVVADAAARLPFGFRTEVASDGELTVAGIAEFTDGGALLSRGVEGIRMISSEEKQVHVQLFQPTPRLTVVGAGDLAEALRTQVQLLGWSCDVISKDPLAGAFGPRDSVVFLTHDHEVATPLLAQLLESSRVGYIGSLGSRGTQQERLDHLCNAGVPKELYSSIFGPAGLNLGSRTTSETALSIVAEILAVQRGRDGTHLRSSAGPING